MASTAMGYEENISQMGAADIDRFASLQAQIVNSYGSLDRLDLKTKKRNSEFNTIFKYVHSKQHFYRT